jgi:uncharacterized RDD family membrane protein YckC
MSLGGDLVSGEAVLLEVRLARFPSRALARLIDTAIQIGLLLATFFFLAAADVGDDAAASAITLVLLVLIIVGYPLLFESLTAGRTPGKMGLGLRAVRDDGGALRVRHSLVRALVGVLEIWLCLGVIAILTSLVSTRGKRLGDLAAGTVVVRDRVPEQAAPILAMPPQLAAWAAGLELSRLPDALALATRQMLGRASTMAPGARQQMAQRMAYDVAQYVSPPPPVGCPPELYLAAVLAERRRREIARLERHAAAAAPVAPLPYAVPQPAAPATSPGADPAGFHPPV